MKMICRCMVLVVVFMAVVSGVACAGYEEHKLTEEARAEAALLWERFYNAVKHMDGNDTYNTFFNMYARAYVREHAGMYEKHTNGTEEDWLNYSPFERFLWYETYIRPVDRLRLGNYDWFFGTEKEYRNTILSNTLSALSLITGEEAKEAYENLMMWQYGFIKEHNDVYNFMTGVSFREDMAVGNEFDPIAEGQERAEAERALINKEIEEIRRELGVTETVEEDGSSGGIGLVFVPLLLALGGLIGVIVYRKRSTTKK